MRSFLDSHWRGTRSSGTKYTDLWTFAELVDLELAAAHAAGGVAAVNWALATSDRLEHTLSRLGAEFSLQVTGDWTMFTNMLTTQPPGEAHIMPDWAVVQARNLSKVEHQQRAWLKGDHVDDEGNVVAGGGAARRRKAKPKEKGKGDKDKGKGGAKGDGKTNAGGGAQGS